MTEIAAGHPVLGPQNLSLEWYPRWHYAVAIAYNLDLGHHPALGAEPERVIPIDTFEHTWRRGDDWALVVLSSDDLPASGRGRCGACGGRPRACWSEAEAAIAYSSILERWPDSYPALFGLGNVRYQSGDLAAAESAFRLAISVRPERAEAWNNLAYVLAADGRRKEAVSAARRAVALSPGNEQPYLETLRDLSET